LNGYSSDIQMILEKLDDLFPQNFPILRLIKMFVFNHLGTIALNSFDEKKASETFEMAYQLGQGMPIEPAWKQMYWSQLGSSILGLGRCWLYANAAERAINYLRSPYPVFVFSQIQNEDLQLEKDILLGELLDETGEFDLALVHFEAALDTCRSAGNSLKMKGVLALQANCYRRMGKSERAIEYYAPVFEDQSQPDSVRIVVGLDFAGCLFERRESANANKVLDDIEDILEYYRDNDSFIVDFAKLWKYRAFDKRESGDVKGAVECAGKSLFYWDKIPSALDEQKQMQDLINLLRRSL
jgi:tetratricopeptide (TPR) repeat protein